MRPPGWSSRPAGVDSRGCGSPVAKLSPPDVCAQDDQARRAAIHHSRYLRWWTDPDGAGRLDARLTPDALARFQAYLHPYQRQQFDLARQTGGRERPECYAADALLVALADTALSVRSGSLVPTTTSDVAHGTNDNRPDRPVRPPHGERGSDTASGHRHRPDRSRRLGARSRPRR